MIPTGCSMPISASASTTTLHDSDVPDDSWHPHDDDPDRGSPRRARFRHALRGLAAVSCAALVSVGAVGLLTWLYQRQRPPTCYGIGWGCTPDAGTSALLYGFVIVIPGVAATTVLLAATTVARTDRGRRVGAWLVSSLACALAVGAPLWSWASAALR